MTRNAAVLSALALEVLRRNGGLAPLRLFVAAGLTGPDMGRLRHLGVVLRPRIGWYLEPTAPASAVQAVRVGGVLTCVSAVESYGMFIPEGLDGATHVSVPPDITRMRRADDPTRHVHAGDDHLVHLHWERRLEAPRGWRSSPVDALLQMGHCTTVRWLTAAVDSARNTAGGPAIITESETAQLRAALPVDRVAAVDRSDPLAESVGETFIRLEAGDRHIPWRSQARLTSLYRSDGIVDEWLPIESDGIKHHSGKAVTRDRERDAVIAYFGHPPLRFTHNAAVRETEYVGDVIQQVWRRGR
jgi:very-short-patch-repair endonuclease